MKTKAKTPCVDISTGPAVGMGLTIPSTYYYTPHFPESQLMTLYHHALSRERYHRARLQRGGHHADLLAKHRAVRRFLEIQLVERTWEVN